MGRFHSYSFGNILEIARQKPDATRFAGLYAWNQLGRKVKKGERGIRILAPLVGIRRKKDEEVATDIRTQISSLWLASALRMYSMSARRKARRFPDSQSASPATPDGTATALWTL
jgi:N-terminal domain of anti-restriction factor ArdC